jgi:hypothetical protein
MLALDHHDVQCDITKLPDRARPSDIQRELFIHYVLPGSDSKLDEQAGIISPSIWRP